MASPMGPVWGRPTPTCSPARCARSRWTRSSTRSPGRRAGAIRPAPQPLYNRQGSAQGAYATLLEFFRLCDRGGPNCAFSHGDPQRRYAALARRLLVEPAQLPDGPVTYNDLVNTTFLAMYDPATWPALAEYLQQLDTLTSPPATAAAKRVLDARLEVSSQERYLDNEVEGRPGVACSESDNPDHVGAWRRAADAADRRFPTSAGV